MFEDSSPTQLTITQFFMPLDHQSSRIVFAQWTAPFRLFDLPVELIYEIFAFMEYKPLGSCRQTCLRLRHIIDRSTRLRLPFLYNKYNTVHPNFTPFHDSASESLRLSQRERHWRRLTPRFNARTKVEDCLQPEYFLFLDILVILHHIRRRNGRVTQKITIVKTPNEKEGETGFVQWSFEFSVLQDGLIMALSADPKQDLLVLVVYTGSLTTAITPTGSSYAVRFLKLSENCPHPAAPDHAMTLSRSTLYGAPGSFHPAIDIHIRRSIVLIQTRDQFNDATSSVSIINYKMGAPAFHKFHVPHIWPAAHEITFVSDAHFLVFEPHKRRLDIYYIKDQNAIRMSQGPTFYASFILPTLENPYAYRATYIASNNATHGTVSSQANSDSGPHACPDRGILVIGLCVYRRTSGHMAAGQLDNHFFDLVIQIEPLMDLARRQSHSPLHNGICSAANCTDVNRPHRTPELWKDWGSRCARFIPQDICDSPWGSVYGYRVVRSFGLKRNGDRTIHDAERSRLHVLDFNPLAIDESAHAPHMRMSLPEVDRGFPKVKVQKLHHVIEAPYQHAAFDDHVFAEDVYCPMPYRETFRTFGRELIDTAFLSPSGVISVVQAKDGWDETRSQELEIIAAVM